MANRDPQRIDELLAHTAWIRRIAASLVREGTEADDIVQGTWLAALQSPPSSNARLSSWLAAVARNLARKRVRGEVRRTRRELDAPDYREALSPEALVER